jgi:hypothetical protein
MKNLKNSYKKDHGILAMLMAIVWVLVLTGCSSQNSPVLKSGVVSGNITIGPLCPVQTIPPDPNCLPTQETYNAWPIAIWTADKKTKIGLIQPKLDGTYEFELLDGNYIIDLDKQHLFGSNLPASVKIEPDETILLNIDIDTGIR